MWKICYEHVKLRLLKISSIRGAEKDLMMPNIGPGDGNGAGVDIYCNCGSCVCVTILFEEGAVSAYNGGGEEEVATEESADVAEDALRDAFDFAIGILDCGEDASSGVSGGGVGGEHSEINSQL
jgi:hypothetical protein